MGEQVLLTNSKLHGALSLPANPTTFLPAPVKHPSAAHADAARYKLTLRSR